MTVLFVRLAVGAGTGQQHADPDPPVAPAQAWQIGIYLVTAFGLMLAAAGGVGAVAVLVTFYIVIGGQQHVPAGTAVGMISCVMAGSGLAHVLYYSSQRHPVFKDRALIDPNLMILITAPGIAGVALGGLANRVAPVWLVVRQKWQAAVLKLVAVRFARVGAPTQQQQQQQQPTVVVVQDDAEVAEDADFFAVDANERITSLKSQPPILHQSSRLQSFSRWESFLVLQQKSPLQVWRKKHFVLLALMAAAAALPAGALNGFTGTGGAFILARIALAVDTHPAVMAATLQSSVLGWAASGLAVYGLLGQVPWSMGGILMMIAAASTALGHATVSQYIKRTGRFWVILAVLAVCAAVSAAMAVYNTAVVLRIVAKQPELWTATGTMCHKVTL
ncbi:hypothetical protein OEZ86_008302 [Tetradesmus obliquus]|nr:hypothetical protein OEZ86_008302 [Tetradesmus obliquus]